MSKVHSTAIIGEGVKLGNNVSVGAYTVIEGNITIGNGVEIANNCTVWGNTMIGDGTRIFPGAVIGAEPQDKKYDATQEVFLEVGCNNVIREGVTFNTGTTDGGGITRVGDNNLFMAYAHVAHDCIVGNNCVLANAAALAGHVTLEDGVILGGLCGVHQFVRIGKMSIMGGLTKAIQDIPPYAMCDGNPAKIHSINIIGLRRANFSKEQIKALKKAFKILFHSQLSRVNAIEKVKSEIEQTVEVEHVLNFVQNSERGLTSGIANDNE